MKTHGSLLPLLTFHVCTALLCTATLFAGSPASTEMVAERLSDQWLSSAQQIRLPDKLILYHGAANGLYTADKKDWVGAVQGEVLILQADTAEACSRIQFLPSEKLGGVDPVDPRFTLVHSKTTISLQPASIAKAPDLSPSQTANWHRYLAASTL